MVGTSTEGQALRGEWHTMATTERLDSPTIEELMVYPFNRIELRMAESGVKHRSAAERDAIAEMVRTRGAAYAARFRHAAELSWRMPEMYWTAQDDGRMTIDHMDAIWRRMDRHTGLREQIGRRERRRRQLRAELAASAGTEKPGGRGGPDHHSVCEPDYGPDYSGDYREAPDRWQSRFPEAESAYSTSADTMVERAVVEWLRECPHRLITVTGSGSMRPRSTVTIHRLRDVVDTAVEENLEMHRRFDDEDNEDGRDSHNDDNDEGGYPGPVVAAPF